MEEDKKIWEGLKSILNAYNDEYYNKGNSPISDKEYDDMKKELEEMEKRNPSLQDKDSPTKNVGAKPTSSFKKVAHEIPMLSLQNSYDFEDISFFDKRLKKEVGEKDYSLVLETKLDGISISLIYNNGKLVRGLTRGNGKVGEDITENVKMCDGVPLSIKTKKYIEIRGEMIILKEVFEKVNNERIRKGETPYANPRNLVSGTMRLLDSKEVKERPSVFYAYQLANYKDFPKLKTHFESIDFLEELGFITTGIFEVFDGRNKLKNIHKEILSWEQDRALLPYEIDGMVIKVNEYELYDTVGKTMTFPKWAIAYKFETEKIYTRIENVTFQVGKTGLITPVAELEEVLLAGTKVSRATLHNFDEIAKKDIRIGDLVQIEKAAEIIPHILEVNYKARTGTEKEIKKPTKCPYCNCKVEKVGNVGIRCINEMCSERIKQFVKFFVSKECMNIDGIGEALIGILVHMKLVHSPLDLYYLKESKDRLIGLDGLGEKSIKKILDNIENSRKMPFSSVITSLGIPNVGKHYANILSEHFKNIENIKFASQEDLEKVKGIGSIVAKSIVEWFKDETNQYYLELMICEGFKMEIDNSFIPDNPMKDKVFLFTGKFVLDTRDNYKKIIIKNGGKVSGSFSKKVNYLIYGFDAGSKMKKAIENDIQVMDEKRFRNIFLSKINNKEEKE